MYMYALAFVLLLYGSVPIFVAADCYPTLDCDIDTGGMKAAIELIPDPDTLLPTQQPDASAYHVPALFEDSDAAQILIRIGAASGIVLDGDGLMTHLWPHAKHQALELYHECNMDTTPVSGMSGRRYATLQWHGPPVRRLEFQIDMTCMIDARSMRGVTTYMASGYQNGSRIGEGRNHSEAGGFGSEWV